MAEVDPYFRPEPLDTDEPSEARYSQHVHAEVTDALIEGVRNDMGERCNDSPNVETDEFLRALWLRGLAIVPLPEPTK